MSTLLTRPGIRPWTVALRLLLLTIVTTIAYTAVVTVIGLVALPGQANGSLVTASGKTVGSALIGQSFTTAKGEALPQWFQSRPSAAGDGYDGGASSGSNLGPNNPDLLKSIEDRKADYLKLNGAGTVPADAVTTSASGLDPHISVENAQRQAARVATTRGIAEADVQRLVAAAEQAPDLGYLGQPTVNVLQLNIALAKLDPAGNS